jgi:hypothetical protein
MAPSSPLPNSGDPGATLACACLNSADLTTVERSDAARSRMFFWSDPLRPIQIERPGPRDTASRTRALAPWPACQCHSQPLIIPGLIPLSDLDRTARTPSEPLGPPSDPSPSGLDRTVRTPSDPCSRPFSL